MGGYTEAAAASGGARTRLTARSRRPRRTSWGDRWFHRLAVLPTTLVMLLIFGVPLLFSAWLSLEGWAPDQRLFGGSFVGLDNYQDLLTDREFIGSLTLTLLYTAVTVTAELLAGLGIALLLDIDLP